MQDSSGNPFISYVYQKETLGFIGNGSWMDNLLRLLGLCIMATVGILLSRWLMIIVIQVDSIVILEVLMLMLMFQVFQI